MWTLLIVTDLVPTFTWGYDETQVLKILKKSIQPIFKKKSHEAPQTLQNSF